MRICKKCKKEITSGDPRKIFCNRSCSSSFNNKGVRRHGKNKESHPCKYCTKLTINPYFCNSKCAGLSRIQDTLLKMEQGQKVADRTVRAVLLHIKENKCEQCELTKWQKQPIPLDVDHIDGNSLNNKKENLRLLCKNCHAQTPTYGIKNKGSGRTWRYKK